MVQLIIIDIISNLFSVDLKILHQHTKSIHINQKKCISSNNHQVFNNRFPLINRAASKSGTHLGGGREENRKKRPDFGKKALIVSTLGLNLPFK